MNSPGRGGHGRLRRPALLAAGIAVVLASTLSPGRAEFEGLRIAGFMPFDFKSPYTFLGGPTATLNFVVDPLMHRGFYLAEEENKLRVIAYDLVRLRRIGAIAWPSTLTMDGHEVSALDETHHRLFYVSQAAVSGSTNCDEGSTLVVLDTRALTVKAEAFPCVTIDGLKRPFVVQGISYFAPTDKLYAVGMGSQEAFAIGTALPFTREPTVFVSFDAESLAREWVVDASANCDWHQLGPGGAISRATRVGDDLFSYCYQGGPDYVFGGTRGAALVMHLQKGKPVSTKLGYDIQTSPTYTDPVVPTVDPATGRLLLYSANPPYGRAVWGYDANRERFFGVVPGGEPSTDKDDKFQGFDPATGRLYISNPHGVVVVDARQSVLSGGTTYRVLENSREGDPNSANGIEATIGIDGGLRRLFFPYPKKNGFVVLQDDVPIPAAEKAPDLDPGTADIAEVPGKTASSFSGNADAFGVHVVMAGGIPGAIDNYDQTCFDPATGLPSPRSLDPNQRCLADQLLTAGNREYFAAQTGSDLGADSGASAFGSTFSVATNDTATDADFRSLASCFTDRVPSVVPTESLPKQVIETRDKTAAYCRDRTPLRMFANGARDADGRDVPFRGSLCVDDTNKAKSDSQQNLVGDSDVLCDATKRIAAGQAELAMVALPSAAQPIIRVARASSSVKIELTAAGTVTTVTAEADGISLGGVLTIGRVVTQAVTIAHGRTGKSGATYDTVISDVDGLGVHCAATCNTDAVVADMNRAFSSQGRIRIVAPFKLHSPRGYQGLVVKDPELRASDSAILNDDTDTATGLDIILNNDGFNATTNGPNARSRVLISLAGVHAESRYGIFPVSFSGGIDVPGFSHVIGPPSGSMTGAPPAPNPAVGEVAPASPHTPAEVVRQVWRLLVNHPRQAALLFVLWMVLASPIYLALRSRSLVRALRP